MGWCLEAAAGVVQSQVVSQEGVTSAQLMIPIWDTMDGTKWAWNRALSVGRSHSSWGDHRQISVRERLLGTIREPC